MCCHGRVGTLWLVLGVGLGVSVLGTGSPPWSRSASSPAAPLFAWALLLPLAVPTFVLATVYIGLLDYAGPVQTLLRKHLPGIPTIEVRNHWGVLAVLVRTFP